MSKKKRPRSKRRAQDRELEKLTRDIERLAKLSPGGAPDRPLEIAAPSEVEVHVRSFPCPRCRSSLLLDDHAAETHGTARLRVAHVTCSACTAKRSIYFRLAGPVLN